MADTKLSQLSGIQLPLSGADKIYIARNGFSYQAPVSGLVPFNMVFTPLNNQPPATNYATLDINNDVAMLSFNENVAQSGAFVGVIPYGAAISQSVNVDIRWIAETGAGDCVWGAHFRPLTSNSNLIFNNFGPATTGTFTALTTGLTRISTLSVTGLSGLSGGDSYRLGIFRFANSAADTLVGNAQVHTVSVRGA